MTKSKVSSKDYIDNTNGAVRALVVHPRISWRNKFSVRDSSSRLLEAVGLSKAIDLDVVDSYVLPVSSIHPKTFFGSGRLGDIGNHIEHENIDLVVFDGPLTGGQQRNLEKIWKTKVIDRTGLILEIFGKRALTKEGALQVELAALKYQRGRLVRSWTHLERQRGGFGFMGGPGETQIEADRRHIDARIDRIKHDLGRITKTRRLHRDNRARVPWPVCALVGYTNAGKSTLFNHLTGENIFAEDMLFATLDPTMRAVSLPNGQKVIFSDTVGFISDLPPTLIAAFRSTLEEVVCADIILHIRDISNPDTESQNDDVELVLDEMGINATTNNHIIDVLNKIDCLDPSSRTRINNRVLRNNNEVAISSVTGEGVASMLNTIESVLNKTQPIINIDIPLEDGATISWLYSKGNVYERRDDEELAHFKVGLDPADIGRFHKFRRVAE